MFSKKIAVIFFTVFLVILFIMIIRPMPQPDSGNCKLYSGTVEQIIAGEGDKDIVIKCKAVNHIFYINRGLESGLIIDELKDSLLNKPIEVLTINHWTPLDPFSKNKHVARIIQNGKIIYDEF